jgi:hypothetical protein
MKLHKCLLLAAAVTFPLPAYALDLTPDSTRILTDPTYLPLSGQLWGYTAYSHTWTNGDSFNDLGNTVSSFHVNADTIDQYIGFGVTDDFMIDASIRWTPDSNRQIDRFGAGSETLSSSGVSNPTFGATYRLIDQAASPVSLDVFGSYTPNWLDADNASATQEGTIASGGQSGSVGAAIGQELRDFTIRGAFTANFLGESNSFDLGDNDVIHDSAHTNYIASLDTQTRLTDLFSVNAGFAYTFANGSTVTNTFNGITHDTAPGNIAAFDLALNYQLVPNAMVAGVTYDYQNVGDSRNMFVVPTSDNGSRDRNANILGVRLTYAFP